MTSQIELSMIVIVLVVASLIASSGVGAAESIDEISCTYSISTTNQSFGDIGGKGSVSVTSPDNCSWTATSNDDWITVTSGDSGNGSGTVGYSVDANPEASSRTGTITIAGETFTVTQDGIACTYSISPTNQSFGNISGSGSVSVTSLGDCSWTATSNYDWITITSGDSGNGSGTVGYSVAANPEASSRTGTITIAGETFTVTQDGIACTYSISPTSQSFGDIGGNGSVSVTSPDNCSWTATSNDDWITVTSGDSGNGSGTVDYSVAANPEASSRTGNITIVGEIFTVTQDGIACTYSILPANQSFGNISGSGNVSVTSPGDCSWTATSNDDWITVTSGDSGSGSGTVAYSVAANPGPSSRRGNITIAGETFTVTQDGITEELTSNPGGPYFGTVNVPISFSGSATGGTGVYTAWHWAFGDGESSDEQNPSYAYTTAGNYTVTVTVTDSSGTISDC
ncbi:MAG TPA: BACON domain-containing carbohydrate-binding protein [Candidatus Nanoarchaeia archaeon]|nr:BACON domain-containing carbohydrate-binding protein [Candidatus Nanoarchaeia archaeon]